METVWKPVAQMTPEEVRMARRITLRDGSMKETLDLCREGNLEGNVGMIFEGGKLVSWCLSFNEPRGSAFREPNRMIYFCTKHKERRKGYASKLFKDARIRYKTFRVEPWNKLSGKFFVNRAPLAHDRDTAKYWVKH
jgi:hypothetical protein